MSRRNRARLERVEDAIDELPLREDLLAAVFARFRETGELPNEQRIAGEVVEMALRGGKPKRTPVESDFCAAVERVLGQMEREARGEEPEPEPSRVREHLFHEAVYGEGINRVAAREVLRFEVGLGGDVTDPAFLADRTLPSHACLGLHLLGFPEILARPPFRVRARRLFKRFDDLRERIDQDDPSWQDEVAAALDGFHDRGELPDYDLLSDVVLAIVELHALVDHAQGRDVNNLMAMLERAQTVVGDDRDAALADVAAMVAT